MNRLSHNPGMASSETAILVPLVEQLVKIMVLGPHPQFWQKPNENSLDNFIRVLASKVKTVGM